MKDLKIINLESVEAVYTHTSNLINEKKYINKKGNKKGDIILLCEFYDTG